MSSLFRQILIWQACSEEEGPDESVLDGALMASSKIALAASKTNQFMHANTPQVLNDTLSGGHD